jgi:hypothetical protein
MSSYKKTPDQPLVEKTMKTPKIPRLDSIEELARFWDTHDLTEFKGELEEVGELVFEGGQGRSFPCAYDPKRPKQ